MILPREDLKFPRRATIARLSFVFLAYLRLSGLERGLLLEFQFRPIESRHSASEQIKFLTGLTGLPPFPLFLQESDFEVGPNKLTYY
jgi:hypothetical protein